MMHGQKNVKFHAICLSKVAKTFYLPFYWKSWETIHYGARVSDLCAVWHVICVGLQRTATAGAFCSTGNLAASKLNKNLAQFHGSHETSATTIFFKKFLGDEWYWPLSLVHTTETNFRSFVVTRHLIFLRNGPKLQSRHFILWRQVSEFRQGRLLDHSRFQKTSSVYDCTVEDVE